MSYYAVISAAIDSGTDDTYCIGIFTGEADAQKWSDEAEAAYFKGFGPKEWRGRAFYVREVPALNARGVVNYDARPWSEGPHIVWQEGQP